jgi:DNA-binding MarR family transcriptional regulator
VEQLYHYIYWQAWTQLDTAAQQALLLMPLVTESGGDLDYLTSMAAAAGLSAITVSDALERLVALSLVDSRGGLHERRYTIHALTRTFLQEQVLKWHGNR